MNRNRSQASIARALEIEQLEVKLTTDPDNLVLVTQLADLYLSESRDVKAAPLIKKAVRLFKDTQLSVSQGLPVYELVLKYWKMDRFVNKGNMRINITEERKKKLRTLLDVILLIHKMRDPMHQQDAGLKLAFVKECCGSLQDSLTLLSDLISAQASNGVDLSYIIFKAAVLLKHIGEHKQAIEYLEYLQDDPPLHNGFNKLHVMAFLILVYEQAEEKYRVFLPKAYKDLATSLENEESPAGERSQTPSTSRQTKKLMELVKNKSVKFSSELWELLAFQALDRCEYVIAAEFLNQASLKAPNKGPLLHCLIEVLFLLGEKDAAGKLGDKAMILLPASADLRNLLLLIDPDKWGEKLRFIGPTAATEREGMSGNQDTRDISPSKGPPPSALLADEETQPPPPSEAHPDDVKKKPSVKGNEKLKDKGKEKEKDKSKKKDIKDNKPPATESSPPKEAKRESGSLFSKLKSSAATALQNLPLVRAKSPERPTSPEQQTVAPVSPAPMEKKPSFKQELPVSQVPANSGKNPLVRMPPIDDEARRVLQLALKGANVRFFFFFALMTNFLSMQIHYYDPTLANIAAIKRQHGVSNLRSKY